MKRVMLFGLTLWLATGVVGSIVLLCAKYGVFLPSFDPAWVPYVTPSYFFGLVILPCLLSWIWYVRELKHVVA